MLAVLRACSRACNKGMALGEVKKEKKVQQIMKNSAWAIKEGVVNYKSPSSEI